MKTAFEVPHCRWLLVSLVGLDAIGPRLWTRWLLGDEGRLSSGLSPTNRITAYYLALGFVLWSFARWRNVDCRRLFGAAPRAGGVLAASCIGIALLLMMVWADNSVTPIVRAWGAGLMALDARRVDAHPIAGAAGLAWWHNLMVACLFTPWVEEVPFPVDWASRQALGGSAELEQAIWTPFAGISILIVLRAFLWPAQRPLPYDRNRANPVARTNAGSGNC